MGSRHVGPAVWLDPGQGFAHELLIRHLPFHGCSLVFHPRFIHLEAGLIAPQEGNRIYASNLFHSIACCQYEAYIYVVVFARPWDHSLPS